MIFLSFLKFLCNPYFSEWDHIFCKSTVKLFVPGELSGLSAASLFLYQLFLSKTCLAVALAVSQRSRLGFNELVKLDFGNT